MRKAPHLVWCGAYSVRLARDGVLGAARPADAHGTDSRQDYTDSSASDPHGAFPWAEGGVGREPFGVHLDYLQVASEPATDHRDQTTAGQTTEPPVGEPRRQASNNHTKDHDQQECVNHHGIPPCVRPRALRARMSCAKT